MSTNKNDRPTTIFDEAFARVFNDLGIEHDSPDVKEECMSLLGRNMFDRVMLEMLKAVPRSMHAQFEHCIERQNIDALREFLGPYVGDIDAFIQTQARDEYAATIQQG